MFFHILSISPEIIVMNHDSVFITLSITAILVILMAELLSVHIADVSLLQPFGSQPDCVFIYLAFTRIYFVVSSFFLYSLLSSSIFFTFSTTSVHFSAVILYLHTPFYLQLLLCSHWDGRNYFAIVHLK